MKIKVCTGGKCKKNGSKSLCNELKKFAKDLNEYLDKEDIKKKKLKIITTSCQSNCKNAPSVKTKSKEIDKGEFQEIKKIILKKYKLEKLDI